MHENYLCFLIYYALGAVFPDLFAFTDGTDKQKELK